MPAQATLNPNFNKSFRSVINLLLFPRAHLIVVFHPTVQHPWKTRAHA
jgi:hypothetical protein